MFFLNKHFLDCCKPFINFHNSERPICSCCFYEGTEFQRSLIHHSRSASSTGFLERVSWGQGGVKKKIVALKWLGAVETWWVTPFVSAGLAQASAKQHLIASCLSLPTCLTFILLSLSLLRLPLLPVHKHLLIIAWVPGCPAPAPALRNPCFWWRRKTRADHHN